MSNKRISQLEAHTNPQLTDLLAIVNAGQTKKITFGELTSGFTTPWGNIVGTLSDQADLQAALDGKASAVHTHVEAAITDLDKYTQAEVDGFITGRQPLDSDLTAIAGLTPANDDIIQRKGGAWVNRTPAQFKVDLALTKNDVGLGNVDNIQQATKTEFNAHVADTSNPHQVTLEQARSQNNTLAGDIVMGGNKITGLGTPTDTGDATTKGYVDSLVQGLDWQDSVLDKDLTTPPVSPTTGDRYIVASVATGAWAGQENNIAEWNGSSWDFETANEGFATWIEDENRLYVFNGSTWVVFGSTIDHGNLNGLADDDHTQYALLAGRSGGQVLIGGTDASDDLLFNSTSNGTKGLIAFGSLTDGLIYDETGKKVGIGKVPTGTLSIDTANSIRTETEFIIGAVKASLDTTAEVLQSTSVGDLDISSRANTNIHIDAANNSSGEGFNIFADGDATAIFSVRDDGEVQVTSYLTFTDLDVFTSAKESIASLGLGFIDIMARGDVRVFVDTNANSANAFRVFGNGIGNELLTLLDTGQLGLNQTNPTHLIEGVVDDTDNRRGIFLVQNDVTNNPNVAEFQQNTTGRNLFLDTNANARSLEISSTATTEFTILVNSVITGNQHSVLVQNNAANANADKGVITAAQLHASGALAAFRATQNGSGDGLTVEATGTSRGIFVDHDDTGTKDSVAIDRDGNNASDIVALRVNVANAGAGEGYAAIFETGNTGFGYATPDAKVVIHGNGAGTITPVTSNVGEGLVVQTHGEDVRTRAFIAITEFTATADTANQADGFNSQARFLGGGNLTSTANQPQLRASRFLTRWQATGGETATFIGSVTSRFQADSGTTGTITNLIHYHSEDVVNRDLNVTNFSHFCGIDANAAGTGTITNLNGVLIEDLTQGTNNRAYIGEVSSGSNKWNLYMSGTADNYLNGNLGLGVTTPNARLHLNGREVIEASPLTNITAAGGLTPTHKVMVVQGNGGAVTITRTPSIVSPLTNEILIIQGASDTNTVTFQDESNLANSDLMLSNGLNMTLGKGDTLTLRYDGTDGKWYEISRSDN